MSMFKPKSAARVLTTATATVYTAPSQFRAEVESLTISSSHNNAVTVTIQWLDASNNTWYNLFAGYSVAANNTLVFENVVHLERLGAIRAQCSVDGTITLTLKIKETFANSNV